MNKFVKGAKNLAFALSFVTIAACGNVKKADLDSLKNDLVKSLGEVNGKVESIDKKIGSVESGVAAEVQKVKTEVWKQIVDDRKNSLFDVLKADFSGLGDVIKMKGCEKLLEGFEFKGEFMTNEITVVGKVEKDGFKKEFGSSSAVACDDKFFENFVKCGGKIVLKDVEDLKIVAAGSTSVNLVINGKGGVGAGDTCKVFKFLKVCGVLRSVKALKDMKIFDTAKRICGIDKDYSKEESESIINAIADDNSIKYDTTTKSGGLIVASFAIGGKEYKWDIAIA